MIGVEVTPLKRIPTPKGDVLHAIKATDPGFAGFGEAYFSEVRFGMTKGWKRHRVMTLNLVVVAGAIRFLVRDGTGEDALRAEYILSPEPGGTYARLTVAPGLWMAFEGMTTGTNLLLNLASHGHDPQEAETLPLEAFPETRPVA